MSSLTHKERLRLEDLFGMTSGYVLHFSDRTFADFFTDYDIEIHSDRYQVLGTSKANKLRAFWKLDDDHIVGQTILSLLEDISPTTPEITGQITKCKEIAGRLLSGKVNLEPLRATAITFDLPYMERQIKRMEQTVESEPDLAIGTAKELIETCCKSILKELNIEFNEKEDDLIKLVRLTMGQLKILPDNIDANASGADIVKKILGNLAVIAQGMAELRNQYGTGHGKVGKSKVLQPRHARLAVSSSSALVHFLFETHRDRNQIK